MTLPKDCNNIEMCKKAKELLSKKAVKRAGKQKDEIVIVLEGIIRSSSSFKIVARLDVEEKLSKTLTLNGYELIIEVDNGKGSIFFGVNVHLETGNSNLDLKGKIVNKYRDSSSLFERDIPSNMTFNVPEMASKS